MLFEGYVKAKLSHLCETGHNILYSLWRSAQLCFIVQTPRSQLLILFNSQVKVQQNDHSPGVDKMGWLGSGS